MCGITGYTGSRTASPILLDGLKRLEYRGYDSAGIAVVSHGSIRLVKTTGKVDGRLTETQGDIVSSFRSICRRRA